MEGKGGTMIVRENSREKRTRQDISISNKQPHTTNDTRHVAYVNSLGNMYLLANIPAFRQEIRKV